jgi:hypothetical protein
MTTTVMRVLQAAGAEQPQVHHVHDPELLPFARGLAALGHRVIYDAHEDLPKDVAIKTYLPAWSRPVLAGGLYAAEPLLARGLAAVVVPVDYMRTRFSRFGARRVVALRNLPRMARFVASERELREEVRIVYVGSLSRFRGIGTDVDAMGHLPPHLKARLILYGGCDPPTLIDDLRLRPGWARTSYGGIISHAELPRTLAEADIGIATLHPTDAYVQVLPTKLFEYMASGLPVIVSDFPVWRKFIEEHDCGVCVDPTSPVAIGRAIGRLIENPEERRRLGANGRRASLSFSWEEEAKRLVTLYSDVVADP